MQRKFLEPWGQVSPQEGARWREGGVEGILHEALTSPSTGQQRGFRKRTLGAETQVCQKGPCLRVTATSSGSHFGCFLVQNSPAQGLQFIPNPSILPQDEGGGDMTTALTDPPCTHPQDESSLSQA